MCRRHRGYFGWLPLGWYRLARIPARPELHTPAERRSEIQCHPGAARRDDDIKFGVHGIRKDQGRRCWTA